MSNFIVAKSGTNYKLQVKHMDTQPLNYATLMMHLIWHENVSNLCDHCRVWPET